MLLTRAGLLCDFNALLVRRWVGASTDKSIVMGSSITSCNLILRMCSPPQADSQAAFERERDEALRRLDRERRVLDKQSKAILKIPGKKVRGGRQLLVAPNRTE